MTDRIVCPNCGYSSSTHRATCKQCHEKLPIFIESPLNPSQSEVVTPEQTQVAEAKFNIEDIGKFNMAVNTNDDQSHAYAAYIELVQSFNSSNAEYLSITNKIANQRQRAIERAIEIHINPVIATVRSIQVGSIIAGIISLLFLCGALSLLGNPSPSSEATGSGGFGLLVLLVSLGLGVLAVIVFIWTSSKISDLNNSKTFYGQGQPPIIPNHNS